MFRLALKMLRKDLKSSIFYLLVMILTIAIVFIFTCSSGMELLTTGNIDYSQITSELGGLVTSLGITVDPNSMSLPPVDYLNGVIVFFSCFLMFYMNKNYTFNKRKEIAILTVSGAGISQIVLFLSFLLLLSFIPGILIGYKGVSVFFKFISDVTHCLPIVINSKRIFEAMVYILTIFIFLVFYMIVYTYRLDIKELLSTKNNIKVINEPPVHSKADFTYLLMYLVSVICIMFIPYKMISLTIVFIVVGIFGIVNGYISRTIIKLKQKKLLTNRYLLISASNFSSTLLTNKITILSMIFSIILMFFITVNSVTSFSNFVLSSLGYIIAVVLLSFTVTFDLITQAKQRSIYYVNLWKIGYTRKELIKIIRQELVMLYFTITLITVLVNFSIGMRYVIVGSLNMTVLSILLGFYLVFILITSLISYFIYIHTINVSIVEEK